jgi:hypothetical protein
MASMPRQDIAKKLNNKLLDQFANKDWKIKKKGCEELEAILKEAGMRIENNGLTDLMTALKKGMAEPNKAPLKAFI